MKRGEVYYIQHRHTVGSEVAKGRPAIIVSNDCLNATSEVVEVVFLTTKPKKEMRMINVALMVSLGVLKTQHFDSAVRGREEVEPEPRKQESDAVNHPSHYTDGKIEAIDYIEDKKFGYHLGNAVKYISRAGKKDPSKYIEDLKKAAWYINREIERLEAAEG